MTNDNLESDHPAGASSNDTLELLQKRVELALNKPIPSAGASDRRERQLKVINALLEELDGLSFDNMAQYQALSEIEEKLLIRIEEIKQHTPEHTPLVDFDADGESTTNHPSGKSQPTNGLDLGLPFDIPEALESKVREKRDLCFEFEDLQRTMQAMCNNLERFAQEEKEIKAQTKELTALLQQQVKTRNDDPIRAVFQKWADTIQSAFFKLKEAAWALPSPSSVSSTHQTAVKQIDSQQPVEPCLSQKLPPRNLPTFSGEFSDWASFKDALVTLLANTRYTASDRFARIHEALQNQFHKSLIDGFRATHDLEGAVKALTEHFENPNLLLRATREMAKKIPGLSLSRGEPTIEQWQEFYAAMIKLKAMADACQAERSVRQEIVETLYRKLPAVDRGILRTRPVVDLNEFVEYVKTGWHASIAYQSRGSEGQQPAARPHGRSSRPLQMAATTITDYQQGCVFCCSTTHRSQDCFTYNNAKQRDKRIWRLKICKKCLVQPKHRDCAAPACSRCGRTNHHVLLCFANGAMRQQIQPVQQGQPVRHNVPQPAQAMVASSSSQVNNGHAPQATGERNMAAISCVTRSPQDIDWFEVDNETSVTTINMAAISRMTPEQRERYQGIAVRMVFWAYVRVGSRRRLVRVFQDHGGEPTVIRRAVAEEIRSDKLLAPVVRFRGPGETLNIRTRCEFELESIDGTTSFTAQAWVKDSLEFVSVEPAPRKLVEEAATLGIQLSETESTTIIPDIVLGAEHLGRPELRFLESCQVTPTVVAYRCPFGWSLLGHYKKAKSNESVSMAAMSVEPTQRCNVCPISALREVFGLEDEDENCPLKEVEIRYDEAEKRYYIQLPWASQQRPPNNFYNALCQVKALKRRLLREGHMEAYNAAIQELLSSGQAEKAEQRYCQEGFYLPHHPVIKQAAKKTRVRPVFNASSAVKQNWSLNDCLARGRPLNCDLRQSLVNFRTSPVPLVTDIVRAFLQIRVEPGERDFLRFLWFENLEDDEPTVYRMTSVLFGAVCSPHILGAVLENLFKTHQQKFEALRGSNIAIYMDDLFVDVDTPDKVREVMEQLKHLLSIGSFALHDWTTVKSIAQENSDLPFQSTDTTKCLGLEWQTHDDDIIIQIKAKTPELETITRRQAVSYLSRLYDPLDLLLPLKVKIRELSRRMSQLSSNWDDPLPEVLKEEFRVLGEDLQAARLAIPRAPASAPTKLMIFCDASPEAYGAVAYLLDDEERFTLLAAKGKLAPAKAQTIPKLELAAALSGAQLMEQLRRSPRLSELPCDIFSDSQITLWRIYNQKRKFDQYVQTRLTTIRSLTEGKARWRYVETENNPADLATHGMSFEVLKKEDLWWRGPSMTRLNNPKKTFDPTNVSGKKLIEFLQAPETRSVQCAASTITEPREEVSLKANWYEIFNLPYHEALQKTVTHLRQKEVEGTKTMESRNQGKVNKYDLETYARLKIWRAVQRNLFPSDYLELSRNKKPRDRRLLNSQTNIDEWGVLRTRRRLPRCYSFEMKHPIVLANHVLVRSYITEEHKRLLHSGINHTFASIVEYFHIFKGKNIVRSLLGHCQDCNIERGRPFAAPQADLPSGRATVATSPFLAVGLDFFGPIATTNNQKVYGLIFSCSRTRAVHLEPVTSMNLNTCIMAIKRFVSRRGVPQEIRSDNAPTFRAANNLLAKLISLVKEAVEDKQIQEMNIRWSFSAPRAPWWGGHFERLIGVVKKRLSHIMWRRNMRLEMIWTALAEVEAIVNSRPLCQVDSDGTILTPAHFLIGRRLVAIPFAAVSIEEPIIAQHFQWKEQMMEFCQKWSSEYLLTLRNLSNQYKTRSPVVGELVLIEDKPKHRKDWPIARVVELLPSSDGQVRLVRVETPQGVCFNRAVQSLIPVEVTAGIPLSPGELCQVPNPTVAVTTNT